MKKLFLILFLFGSREGLNAQDHVKDSLLTLLLNTKDETNRVNLSFELSYYFSKNSLPDSAILWATRGLTLAQKINYKKDENDRKLYIANKSWELGDFSTAIKLTYPIYKHGKSINDTSLIIKVLTGGLFNYFRDFGDYKEALKLGFEIKNILEAKKDSSSFAMVNAAMGDLYYRMGKYDSANIYIEKSLKLLSKFKSKSGWISWVAGRSTEKMNNDSLAFYYYYESISQLNENSKDLPAAYNSLSSLYLKKNQLDSAFLYANKALDLSQKKKFNKEKIETFFILSNIYETTNTKKAYEYYKLAVSTRDILYNQEKQRQILGFKFNEELLQNELNLNEIKYRNKIRINVLLGLLLSFFVIMILIYRNFKNKQKANIVLQEQKAKVESTLSQLKSTQAQLIQSEKMASLGELTAGIAHEIQNPLNFVNNFSEVSNELIVEMTEELDKGDIEEAKAISSDIKQNLEKINQHGKRASDIVKGMLEHSRTSTGQKEATDINALCNDYLRLAYQGQKAKNKDFNATMETHFDPNLPKVEVIPQDIGRVLLNLMTNAFYAVNERNKDIERAGSPSGAGGKGGQPQVHDYIPTVSITTQRTANSQLPTAKDQLLIAIKDNGLGIPETIKDKIFQPFFTTKPTGQGTGLGLSLSYDIVKAHGGELKVETKEGEGSIFIIQLPIN